MTIRWCRRWCFPRLTTCQQPLAEMAATAVSMLIQIPNEGGPMSRRLSHQLIIRESTAPPEA
ncbi:MAG: substrate-binding domain-containing protein [Terricaulis sp.]